jgi:hypothetical protein
LFSRIPYRGVEEKLAVDGVRDPALEEADRSLLRLVLGQLALEGDPALCAGIADLGDRCHADGVIHLAVAAPRRPMAARKDL